MKKSILTIIILLLLSAARIVTAQSVKVDTNFVFGGCNNKSMTVIRNYTSESSFKLEINEITSTNSFGLGLTTPTDYNTGIVEGRTINFNLSTNQYGALAMEGVTAADSGTCLVKTILKFAQNDSVIDTIYFFLRKVPFQLMTPIVNIQELKPEFGTLNWSSNQPVNCKYNLSVFGEVQKDSFSLISIKAVDTIKSYTLTNLSPKSKYKIKVSAEFNGCLSNEGNIAFQTPCLPFINVYENNFEENNDCQQLINTTNNGWSISYGPSGYSGKVLQHLTSNSNANNWFISQGIRLQEGDKYYIRYNYSINSNLFTERFRVTIGNSNLNTSNHLTLVNFQGINNSEIKTDSIVFEVDSTDIYYLGINCYSAANQSTLYIDNIKLSSLNHTGIQNQTIQDADFIVFPNPNNGTFNLRYLFSNSAIYNISLINALGQEIWTDQQMVQAGQQTLPISSNLASGVYTLHITNTEEQVQQKIIIK
jgi:hypothetical protein